MVHQRSFDLIPVDTDKFSYQGLGIMFSARCYLELNSKMLPNTYQLFSVGWESMVVSDFLSLTFAGIEKIGIIGFLKKIIDILLNQLGDEAPALGASMLD